VTLADVKSIAREAWNDRPEGSSLAIIWPSGIGMFRGEPIFHADAGQMVFRPMRSSIGSCTSAAPNTQPPSVNVAHKRPGHDRSDHAQRNLVAAFAINQECTRLFRFGNGRRWAFVTGTSVADGLCAHQFLTWLNCAMMPLLKSRVSSEKSWV